MSKNDSDNLEKKKNIMLGPSDILGFIVGVIGAGAAIYSTVNSHKIGVISILISQCLLIVGWGLVLHQIYRNNLMINQMKTKISDYEEDIKEKSQQLEKNEKYTLEQLSVISNAIKSNSIHSNNILGKIFVEVGVKIERWDNMCIALKCADDSNKQLINTTQNYANEFQAEIYDLFNRYCRESTDEALKLQNTYLKLKGISLNVSITIKLMNTAYLPKKNRSEDIKVYTAFRDNDAYNFYEREIGEKLYSINGNTAFSTCLRKDFFIINDSCNQNVYENEHEHYDDLYNCAIVVPIKSKIVAGEEKYFGYLCCDCLSDDNATEVFDLSAANYLYSFAQNMAIFFGVLDYNWTNWNKNLDAEYENILEMLYNKIYITKNE